MSNILTLPFLGCCSCDQRITRYRVSSKTSALLCKCICIYLFNLYDFVIYFSFTVGWELGVCSESILWMWPQWGLWVCLENELLFGFITPEMFTSVWICCIWWQVEMLCSMLCLSEASERCLPQFCSGLLELSPDLSHSTASAVITHLLLPKVSVHKLHICHLTFFKIF